MTRRWRVTREMNTLLCFGDWLSFSPPLSRFATKPCPLDGCPMFADFRVHGLNTTPFPMLSPSVYTYLQERKRRGFAHLVQPMYAKVREHGAPVQGARLVASERSVAQPTHDAYFRFGSLSRLLIRSEAEGSAVQWTSRRNVLRLPTPSLAVPVQRRPVPSSPLAPAKNTAPS